MHFITHLVDCIREKGVTSNYSTDSGEGLHPQSHKDWCWSNQQESAPDQVGQHLKYIIAVDMTFQMLRMEFEREVIMNTCYHLDAYDEYCLFNDSLSSGLNANKPFTHSHVRLGSLGKIMHFGSYAKKLSVDIGLHDLQALLTTFLRLNHVLDITNDVISNSEV